MKQMNGGAMELIDKNQAIEIVRDKCKRIPTCAILAMDAIDKLPVLQKEQDWIDSDEGLPDRMGYYLTSNEYYNVSNDFFDGDYFETAKMYHYKVIAWRELPKPYKKENQNDR